MSTELPDYYFRVRENGAAVFRVDTENRQRRIEMDQIAVVNIKNGEIKPHGDRQLSEDGPADHRNLDVRAPRATGRSRRRRHFARGRSPESHDPMGAIACHGRSA